MGPHSQLTNPKITCGDAAKELGLSESTARRLLKEELDCKPLRQVKSQRVKPEAAQKRLDCCKAWLAQIESGELDPRKIYWTDEKLFRLGACPGGNQNLVIWVKKHLKKSELPNDLILREGGVWQGGCSVMVSLGLSYRGKGTLRFAPSGTKINSVEYIEIVENTYLPDCIELYGKPPTCLFQQDGASSHTANVTQGYLASKFHKFWRKGDWPQIHQT